jgi:L-seryl-tRNA(Ser) seleniumtransferase
MRAMRVDKLTLSAMAATLRLYRNQPQAEQEIPLLRMLSMPLENLKLRADKLAAQIGHLSKIKSVDVIQEYSMLGGGSLPTQRIPTWCTAITPASISVDRLVFRLRDASPAVIGRVANDRFLLDFRTIDPAWDLRLAEILQGLDHSKSTQSASASNRPNGQ